MVETFKITGNWEVQSRELKKIFSQLTLADLKYNSGKEDELLARLQRKLNKERDEVISFIKSVNSKKVYTLRF